jgi:hypothetical protein
VTTPPEAPKRRRFKYISSSDLEYGLENAGFTYSDEAKADAALVCAIFKYMHQRQATHDGTRFLYHAAFFGHGGSQLVGESLAVPRV